MSKELTTNKAIQALVSNFDGYIGNMNDRLKIHAFFNEFDDKARSDLMNLVKISNNRYKCVKSGNNLDTVINKQAQTYRQLANRVLKDEFYTTDDVYNEAKKVKNLRSNRNQKEIAELRMKIKHSNRMIKNPISAEVKSSFQKKNTEGVSKVPSGRRRHLYQPFDTHHHTLDRTVKFFDSSMRRASIKNNKPEEMEPQEQVKNQFADIILAESQQFKESMDNYYGFLDDVRQSFTDGEQMKISKKFNFLTEDLKMLSYKQNNVTNVVAKKIDNTEVDIKKLMKFTKRSKLNQSDNERTNSDTLDNTPIINAFDFKNTIGVVKNEVKNGLQLERLINQKRQKLEEVFKNMELPDIEDYEKIIKRNVTSIKIAQQTADATKQKIGKDALDPQEAMKEIYEMKQTQWKLEDIQRENEQLLQKQRKKETRQFLNQIKKRPRFIQQYVDSYSHREEKINKEIVQLHSILGKKFYDKRKLNKKIDEFINELEHKENERRASDPEWRNAKENEVNLQDEVAEMIKRNLNSQSSDEEEVQIGKGEVNESFVLMSPGSNGKEYEDFLEFKSNVLEKEHERVVRDKERQDSQIDLIRRQSEPKLSRLSSLIFGVIEKRNNSKRNTVNTGDVLRNNLNFVRRRSTLNSDPLAQLGLENKPLGVKKTLSRTNTMLINITTNILKENNRNDAVNVEQD